MGVFNFVDDGSLPGCAVLKLSDGRKRSMSLWVEFITASGYLSARKIRSRFQTLVSRLFVQSDLEYDQVSFLGPSMCLIGCCWAGTTGPPSAQWFWDYVSRVRGTLTSIWQLIIIKIVIWTVLSSQYWFLSWCRPRAIARVISKPRGGSSKFGSVKSKRGTLLHNWLPLMNEVRECQPQSGQYSLRCLGHSAEEKH